MIKKHFFNQLFLFASLLLVAAGCSLGKDEPKETTEEVECTINFVYDMNMIFASTFPSGVTSSSVWVFDSTGKLVMTHTDNSQEALTKDYSVTMKLPAGTYNFVTWLGLTESAPLSLRSRNPSHIEDLSLSLKLKDGSNGVKTFDSFFPPFYHGAIQNVSLTATPEEALKKEITIPITCDTKNLCVMVQRIDNPDINLEDYDFRIENGNNFISWDNVAQATESFYYLPAQISSDEIKVSEESSGVGAIYAYFTFFPFLSSQDIRLVITNKKEGIEIANLPLVEYILKAKPDGVPAMSNQEYLDRQDTYLLKVFLLGNQMIEI